MNRCYALACVFLVTSLTAFAQSESYNDVMLIVNDKSPESTEIGSYFASRRGIPDWHICHISLNPIESIDSGSFKPLQWQIEKWMLDHKLADSINYIVTTKGCPIRVTTVASIDKEDYANWHYAGQASFEDCIALINGMDSVHILTMKAPTSDYPYGRIDSKYFGSRDHFRRDPASLPMYLVTRLDAYTVDQVKALIQRAEKPAAASDGLWELDVDPTKNVGSYKDLNDRMISVAGILQNRGLNVLLNNDATYVHNQQNVIGYCSWGSNDAASGGPTGAIPHNTWLNGAIGHTFVSTSAYAFRVGGGGQSMIADWIAEGISGIVGYTDEPYTNPMAKPDIIFDRYTSGYNMAESFFASMPFVAWRQVVVGDPKMKLAVQQPNVLDVTPDTIRFIQTTPGQPVTMMATLTNQAKTNTIVVDNVTLSGADASSFRIDPSVTFPHSIDGSQMWELPIIFTPSAPPPHTYVAMLTLHLTNAQSPSISIMLMGRDTSGSADAPYGPLTPTAILSSSPNPFSSSINVRYSIASDDARVRIELVDALGQRVATLMEAEQHRGEHTALLHPDAIPSGCYLLRLHIVRANGAEEIRSIPVLHSR